MTAKTARAAAWAVACALVLSACGSDEPLPESAAPGAVVLITVDGLVPERLALYGGETPQPALESLAAEGRAWGDAWTADPMTRPAVATYLTGLAPDRHGVRDDLFARLDDDVPTLAEHLAQAGYETAAFPDSGFLGAASGVLRGFRLYSDPAEIPLDASRWLPAVREPGAVEDDFRSWLGSLSEDSRFFAWLHFSGPLVEQLRDLYGRRIFGAGENGSPAPEPGGPEALERLDSSLTGILELVRARSASGGALVVVAGTQGEAGGGETDPVGPGQSLAEAALRVPVIVAWIGPGRPVAERRTVWAPDVPATIADATGVRLAPEAEGLSLFGPAPENRVVYAWSWAGLDQMGWRAERAARTGSTKRVEGPRSSTFPLDGAEGAASPEEEARLAEALRGRSEPVVDSVALERARPVLESRGLELRPVPPDGRDFGDAESRREVSARLFVARFSVGRGRWQIARSHFQGALELDPQNRGASLDLGQALAVADAERALTVLEPALGLYPTDPELLHWYAHAVWKGSWREAEDLLRLVEPLKTQDADVLYDLACTRSPDEDVEGSERYLRRAIEAGFRNFRHMETDADLRNLRESGRLSAVLREHK